MTTNLEALLRDGPPEDGDEAVARARFVERAAADDLIDVAWSPIDTPVGQMVIAATPAGLVKVALSALDDNLLDELAGAISPRVLEAPAKLDAFRRQLDEYFEGTRQVFDVPIDWQLSRGFRREVLQRLYREVPFGELTSYMELARSTGRPRASRAVGTAMATNPVPIVVPCHRVLRTGGNLGGYGGGLDMKRWLLTHEGSLLA